MINLVIFDLDGVLVDACEWHRESLNRALMETYSYSISEEEHHKTFNGLPTKKKLEILEQRGLAREMDFKKIFELKQKNTIRMIRRECTERQEKIDLFAHLREQGVKVAVCTNSIRKTTKLMLEKSGLEPDFLVTNEDVFEPKPSPEGYNKVMAHFNCAPGETLIIEDSPKGLLAAFASEANVIEVRGPAEVTTELIETWRQR